MWMMTRSFDKSESVLNLDEHDDFSNFYSCSHRAAILRLIWTGHITVECDELEESCSITSVNVRTYYQDSSEKLLQIFNIIN